MSDSHLVSTTPQRDPDNTTPRPNFGSITTTTTSNAFHSPPLPSVFFNAAMSPFPRVPAGPPHSLPPPSFHRQNQETLRHHHPALVGQDPSATNYRRDLGAMEGRQARLAISLILASRSAVFRMDHFMRICDRHIHTAISLLSVSREVRYNERKFACLS